MFQSPSCTQGAASSAMTTMQMHSERAMNARNNLGTERKVQSVAGKISVWDSETRSEINLVVIHGNSACKEVFEPLFRLLCDTVRIIAIDLPGHGESDDAIDPDEHYSLGTFSQVVQEVVQSLNLPNYHILGWSLGGHVAIEALNDPKLKGLIISGTPPTEMTPDGFKKGFYETIKLDALPEELREGGAKELFPLLTKEEAFEEDEAARFHAYGGMDTLRDEQLSFLVSAGQRAHGLARKNTLQSFFQGGSQAEAVLNSELPILAIQGESDAGINNEYIRGLLADRCVVLAGGHGLIYTNPEPVSRLIHEFLGIS